MSRRGSQPYRCGDHRHVRTALRCRSGDGQWSPTGSANRASRRRAFAAAALGASSRPRKALAEERRRGLYRASAQGRPRPRTGSPLHRHSEGGAGDVAARQKGLDDRRQDLNADAREREARQEQAYDLVRGIVGGFSGKKGAPRSRGKPIPVLRPGPGFKPDRKFITPEAFRKLPDKGVIDAQSVRTSQKGFNEKFSEPYIPDVPESQYIDYMVKDLKAGTLDPNKVKPIQIVEWKGHVYTLDHRRLTAYRRAGFEIPYEKVRFDDLS